MASTSKPKHNWPGNGIELERCAVIYTIRRSQLVFCCEFCSEYFDKFLNLAQHLIIHHEFENKLDISRTDTTDNAQEEQEEESDLEMEKLYFDPDASHEDVDEALIENQTMPAESLERIELVNNCETKESQQKECELQDECDQEDECEQLEAQHTKHKHINAQKKAEEKSSMDVSSFTKLDEGFICNYCNCSFLHRSKLRRHMATHAKERKYKCNMCSKTFKNGANYKTHCQWHKKQKKFKCSECNEAFNTEVEMAQHLRSHRMNCGDKSDESAHIRKQTKPRACVCDHCEKIFSERKTFMLHMMSHSNERTFKCDTCDKTFNRKDTLNAHKQLHTDESE